MRVFAILVLLASCGRVAFDPLGGDRDGAGDGSTVAASNLIAWYWLDDLGAGNQLIDRSGHGHDGTCQSVSGCPVVVPGHRATALLFDGVDDQFRVPFAPELNTTTGFTIATWFEVAALQTFRVGIVSKNYGPGNYNSWVIGLETDGTVSEATDGPTTPHLVSSTTSVAPGAWRHLVLRWDGATVEIVLDGSVILTDPFSDIAWDDQTVNIGADTEFDSVAGAFHGAIDDLRLYNRSLTDQEIANIIAEP